MRGLLREESDLKRGVNQKEIATNPRVLPMLLIHPVGFISTGRIKSHRAAWYDTRAIKTDGTRNCYTGTVVQPDGSARNCFHEKFRYTRYGSFYFLSLKSSTKSCARLHEWSCTDFAPKVPHIVLREEVLLKHIYPTTSYVQAAKNHFPINIPKGITRTREMKGKLPRAAFCVGGSSLVLWQQTSWMLVKSLDVWRSEPAMCRQFWEVTFLSFTKHIYTIGFEVLKLPHYSPKHKQNLRLC